MKSDIIKKLYLPQTINRLKRKVHLLGLDSKKMSDVLRINRV